MQNKILGAQIAQKKRLQPIVIEIDEDELLDTQKQIPMTRQAKVGALEIPVNDDN